MPELPAPKSRLPSFYLLLVFFSLTAGIVTAAFLYYRNYEKHYRVEVERQLSAIAELKVGELADWRAERLADGAVFFKNASFSGLVRQFFEKPNDPTARDQLRTWLSHVQAAHEYDRIFLLDTHGVARISVPDTPEPVAAHLLEQAPDILRSGRVAFVDFHRDAPDGPIHMSVLVPVLDDREDTRAMGILVFRIDPEKYLYPYISRWPTPSRTAETLIVRRDGNDALYLNELRFQKNTALKLRIPLGRQDVPAVKAALGQEGIVEGADYRGVPVIAALRAVPDSPWLLVARMDVAEAYAPLRAHAWAMIALVGSLLLGAGGGTGFVWRHQRARFYRERYKTAEALRESESRLGAIVASAQDAILMMDPGGGVSFWNSAAERIFGYTPTEAIGRNLHELIVPQRYHEAYHAAFHEFLRSGQGAAMGKTLELEARRKDGREISVALSLSAVRLQGGWHAVGILRDITKRKGVEEALRATNDYLDNLFNYANAPIIVWDPQFKITRFNHAFEFLTGRSAQEVIGHSLENLFPPKLVESSLELIKKTLGGEPWETVEIAIQHRDGSVRTLLWNSATLFARDGKTPVATIAQGQDITERKRAEAYGEMRREVLQILNEPGDLQDSIQRVLAALKTRTGFDAVGIRPQDGDDFPYFAQEGFPKDFLLTENTLIERAADGGLCRDKDGNVSLECTCGLVISGKTDPANPLFTPGGSCWTNDSFPLLDIPPGEDPRLHPRNQCIHQGYASVALVPIRNKDRIVGLIQLNDRRKGRFTLDTVELLEGIASHIGAALMRKWAEETLRESEERFRRVSAMTSDIAYSCSTKEDGRFLIKWMTGAADRITGYSSEEIKAQGCWSFLVVEEDLGLFEENVIGLAPGSKGSCELRIRHKNGGIVWITSYAECVSETQTPGRLLFFGGLADITERKRAEEALKESEGRMRDITFSMADWVWEVDENGVYTFSSQKGTNILGRSPEDIIGKTPFDFMPPDEAKRVAAIFSEIAANKAPIKDLENWNIRKNGERICLLTNGVPILDAAGNLKGYRGVDKDITERKRAEEEIRRKSKDLQEKNDELTRFIYAVSHDLRSPLVTIQTFQGHLERDIRSQDAARVEKDLGYIRNAADKMGYLLDELRRFWRVGRIMHPSKEAPLQAIVKEALDLVAGRITGRGMRIDLTEEPVVLYGDRTRLVEIFLNLVDNAAKFMGDQPAPRVEIGVEQAGEELALHVRDNGIGIGPELQPLVFGLFHKLDPGSEGEGIGLALVRRIVELHGGRIWVESEGLGKGTTFRFTLAKTRRGVGREERT